jgi:hypothetical protein
MKVDRIVARRVCGVCGVKSKRRSASIAGRSVTVVESARCPRVALQGSCNRVD